MLRGFGLSRKGSRGERKRDHWNHTGLEAKPTLEALPTGPALTQATAQACLLLETTHFSAMSQLPGKANLKSDENVGAETCAPQQKIRLDSKPLSLHRPLSDV